MGKMFWWIVSPFVMAGLISGWPLRGWYDAHFTGWSYTIGKKVAFGCCAWTVGLPPGAVLVADQKATAALASFGAEQRSFRIVYGALQDQNAAVSRWSAASRAAMADSARWTARYAALAPKAHSDAAFIANALLPLSAPLLGRYEGVHAAITEKLK